jgi:hypothetical protein
MTSLLICKLPVEIVDHVKLYTGEGEWRNGRYVNIHRIPNDDSRYTMLKKIPKVRQLILDFSNKTRIGCVWFKFPNNKFVVINKGSGTFWNGYYHINGCFCEMYYNQERTLQYAV